MTPERRGQIQGFILRLTGIHEEAHRIGLHLTGHKLHEAVRTVGWEFASQIVDTAPTDSEKEGT